MMVKNEKGFTLVEVMGMMIIITVMMTPMLTALIGNIDMNMRMHDRQSASAVAETTVNSLSRLTFDDLMDEIDTEVLAGNYYFELNADVCVNLSQSQDAAFCDIVFSQIFNNLSFNSTTFRVFIYNYHLPQSYIDALTDENNTDIPDKVKNYISTLTPSTAAQPDLIRVSVWIQYADEPVGTVNMNGLITDE